jgi:hypothetical protein
MHTRGQDAVAVEAQAGKHYWGHHTHMGGIGRVHIRRVAVGADWSRTLKDIVR